MRPQRTGTSLERRRLIDRGRRLLASVLAGLAVLAILQCLESTVATQTVLLAAADIDRGQAIHAGDVEAVSVPACDAFAGALRHVADAEGLIARVDIAEGMPILGTLADERPATPPGYTVIDVQLSGGWEGLLPGDTVGLTASGICSAYPSDAPNTGETCAIAARAVTMGMPAEPEAGSGTALVPFALPSDEALRILTLQDQGMIVAVATEERY